MISKYIGKRICRLLKTEGGFTLIELLVAAVLFGLVSLAFAYSFISGRSFVSGSGDRRLAITLAQQRLEGLRSQGFTVTEVLVGNPSDEDPVTNYPDYQRVTQVVYVLDNDFSTQSAGATSSLRITVQVDPATGSGVSFGMLELYSVVAR